MCDDVMGGDNYCNIVWLFPGCKYWHPPHPTSLHPTPLHPNKLSQLLNCICVYLLNIAASLNCTFQYLNATVFEPRWQLNLNEFRIAHLKKFPIHLQVWKEISSLVFVLNLKRSSSLSNSSREIKAKLCYGLSGSKLKDSVTVVLRDRRQEVLLYFDVLLMFVN